MIKKNKNDHKKNISTTVAGFVILVGWIMVVTILGLTRTLGCDLDPSGRCDTPEYLYNLIILGPLALGSLLLIFGAAKDLRMTYRISLTVLGGVILTYLSAQFMGLLTASIHGLM